MIFIEEKSLKNKQSDTIALPVEQRERERVVSYLIIIIIN